ncbi:MAG: HAD-IIB family hydrolase [Myxococcota bacterium]
MEPLARLPTSVLARLEGVVFDVDDTVTRDGRLEREAFDAMWCLHDAGVALMAVTGRPLGWCDVWARTWPIVAAVGENGAGWVWRDGKGIHEGYAYPDAARAEQAARLARVRRRVAEALPHVPVAGDQRARRCDLAFDVGETHRLDEPDIDRVVACIEAEGARAVVSSVHAHAAPGDWDKARGAVGAARDALAVDLAAARARWLFVGDSGNDQAAFRWFEHTVGVANVRAALDRLSDPPQYVTGADRGQGFAELAARVLDAR